MKKLVQGIYCASTGGLVSLGMMGLFHQAAATETALIAVKVLMATMLVTGVPTLVMTGAKK